MASLEDFVIPSPLVFPACSRCRVAYVLRFIRTEPELEPEWIWYRDCEHTSDEPRLIDRTLARPAPVRMASTRRARRPREKKSVKQVGVESAVNLPDCPKCYAKALTPCRFRSGRLREAPHRLRVNLAAIIEAARPLVRCSRCNAIASAPCRGSTGRIRAPHQGRGTRE